MLNLKYQSIVTSEATAMLEGIMIGLLTEGVIGRYCDIRVSIKSFH
jgi:hypothetical protein